MSDYMSGADAREIARQTAGMVAAELGDGWTVDTSEVYAEYRGTYLDGPGGARVFLALDWRNGDRLEISGTYPKEAYDATYPNLERCEIGVSRDRGPAVIAREITRRLLPKYTEEMARAQEAIARRNNYNGRALQLAQEIADAIPGATITQEKDRTEVRLPYSSGGTYGTLRVSADTVYAERLSLTAADAVAVARALGGAK